MITIKTLKKVSWLISVLGISLFVYNHDIHLEVIPYILVSLGLLGVLYDKKHSFLIKQIALLCFIGVYGLVNYAIEFFFLEQDGSLVRFNEWLGDYLKDALFLFVIDCIITLFVVTLYGLIKNKYFSKKVTE